MLQCTYLSISLHKSWPVQIFIHFSFAFCWKIAICSVLAKICTIFIGFSLVDCERDRSLRLFARAGLSKYYIRPWDARELMGKCICSVSVSWLTIKYLSCAISFQWNHKCTPIHWARGDDFIKMDNNHSYLPIGNQNVCIRSFLPVWHIVHHFLSVASSSSAIGWLTLDVFFAWI